MSMDKKATSMVRIMAQSVMVMIEEDENPFQHLVDDYHQDTKIFEGLKGLPFTEDEINTVISDYAIEIDRGGASDAKAKMILGALQGFRDMIFKVL